MSRKKDFNSKYFLQTLKTRSEFDVIEDRSSHQRSRSSELSSKLNSTLPSSVLTLALIYNICCEREPDEKLREDFFNAICDKLCELNYLNSSTIALYKSLDISGHYKILWYFLQKVHEQVRSSCSTDSSSLAISRSVHEYAQTAIALQYPNEYEDRFNEIEVIGTGGSGVVCKAVHKVDGGVYAVKKIFFKFKTDAEFEKIIREAKSFAALRHRNIVNYNNAWLDYREETGAKKISSDESSEDSSERLPKNVISHSDTSVSFTEKHTIENFQKDEVAHLASHNESSLEIVFDSNIQEYGNINANRHDERKSSKLKSKKKKSKEVFQWTEENLKEARHTLSIDCCSLEKLVVKATLYIQMEYCEHDLDSWLQMKNNRNSADTMNIFRQILCGVDYIHSKSIIHRDLKPKNIFISNESEPTKIVKIGDFGLACLAQQVEDFLCTHRVGESYSAVHGTFPYSAPEQRNGSKYNFKVDLYSLGIILFEFYEMEVTRVEFYEKLKKFHNGEFRMRAPEQVENLVKKLVRENPDERPSAKDVLKDRVFKKKSLKKHMEDIQHKLVGCVKQLKELEECVCILRDEQSECKQLLKSNKEVTEQTRIQEEEIKRLRDEVNSLKCKH